MLMDFKNTALYDVVNNDFFKAVNLEEKGTVNIGSLGYEMNTQQSVVSGGRSGKSVRMLFIEENGGQMHVLSADNYKIDEILTKMRATIKK